MAEYMVQKESLETVANAIKIKTGLLESDKIVFPEGYASAIMAISSDENEFAGVKVLKTNSNGLPIIVDATSLPKTTDINGLNGMFMNENTNGNGGRYAKLEEVYLPNWIRYFSPKMFYCCALLNKIHGDFTTVLEVTGSAFEYCLSLTEAPYLPRLQYLENRAFANCRFKKYTFHCLLSLGMKSQSFVGCIDLEEVIIPKNWNVSLYFLYSSKLTQESLHTMIENLADMSEATTAPYFSVGSINIDKIDEEHIAMLENKNWNYS